MVVLSSCENLMNVHDDAISFMLPYLTLPYYPRTPSHGTPGVPRKSATPTGRDHRSKRVMMKCARLSYFTLRNKNILLFDALNYVHTQTLNKIINISDTFFVMGE